MPQTATKRQFEHKGGRAPEYGVPRPPQGAVLVETAVEARQAVTGHNVRHVLILSLAALAIAFALIYAAFFG